MQFIKYSNNDKNFNWYSFVEISNICNNNSNKLLFYLFWDILISVSYYIISNNRSINAWAYKNHNIIAVYYFLYNIV